MDRKEIIGHDAFLHEYAEYIFEWLVEGKSVFVYFKIQWESF